MPLSQDEVMKQKVAPLILAFGENFAVNLMLLKNVKFLKLLVFISWMKIRYTLKILVRYIFQVTCSNSQALWEEYKFASMLVVQDCESDLKELYDDTITVSTASVCTDNSEQNCRLNCNPFPAVSPEESNLIDELCLDNINNFRGLIRNIFRRENCWLENEIKRLTNGINCDRVVTASSSFSQSLEGSITASEGKNSNRFSRINPFTIDVAGNDTLELCPGHQLDTLSRRTCRVKQRLQFATDEQHFLGS